jgi:hypothetical protein
MAIATLAIAELTIAEAAIAEVKDRPHVMLTNKPARFPRTGRLLRHADFERVYKEGRRHFSATMTVFYLGRLGEESVEGKRAGTPAAHGLRVGFTVGRALGAAESHEAAVA